MTVIFLLPLLILSKDAKYPKFANIYVGKDYSQEEIDESNSIMSNKKKYCKAVSDEEFTYDDCMDYLDAKNKDVYSPGPNINDAISKVDKSTEVLMIFGDNIGEVDLNNLKSQMLVFITPYNYYSKVLKKSHEQNIKDLWKKMKASSFDGSPRSMIKFVNSFEKKQIKDYMVTEINGGIKDKVAFLAIEGGSIKFTGSDVNVHSLYLKNCKLDSESTKIRTNFLITDLNGYCENYNIFNVKDFIKVNQMSLYYNQGYGNPYRIQYGEESWSVHQGQSFNYQISCNDNDYMVSYEIAEVFNLIAYTNKVDIYKENSVSLSSYKAINITNFEDIELIKDYSKSLLEKDEFEITATGWENENKYPKITYSYDKSAFDLVLDDIISEKFVHSEESLYSYKPKKRGGLGAGAIAGIVIACVVVVAVVVVVVIIVIRKKKQSNESSKEGNANNDEE